MRISRDAVLSRIDPAIRARPFLVPVAHSPPPPPALMSGRSLESLAVLVVEDDEFQRAILRLQLEAVGLHRIAEASGGREALEALDGGFLADVVICDLEMPDTDGMEFLRLLAARRDRPAIVISSAADEAILRSVEIMAGKLDLRVLGILAKPPRAQEIRERLAPLTRPESARVAEVLFEPSLEELRDALAGGQFDAHFQPQMDVRTGRICGAEALARWNHPRLGLLKAGDFVEAMERHGLVSELGEVVLARTAAAIRRWSAAGIDVPVSMNLSAQTLHEPGFAERLSQFALREGIAPNRLVLELTESAAMRDVARSLETLTRLRLRGFGLSIDDFGKGYSSLQRLSRVPYTELKVDRAFVTGAAEAPHLRAMLVACVEIAHKLGIATVAEGVESEADLATVRASGCFAAQGWHVGRPADAEAFVAAVRARE